MTENKRSCTFAMVDFLSPLLSLFIINLALLQLHTCQKNNIQSFLNINNNYNNKIKILKLVVRHATSQPGRGQGWQLFS